MVNHEIGYGGAFFLSFGIVMVIWLSSAFGVFDVYSKISLSLLAILVVIYSLLNGLLGCGFYHFGIYIPWGIVAAVFLGMGPNVFISFWKIRYRQKIYTNIDDYLQGR